VIKKEASGIEKQDTQDKDELLLNETSREKKIMNLVVNTSIILMATLMGGLSQVMVDTMGAAASGMAGAMGGEEAGEKVSQEIKQKRPEVDKKMKEMIADVRKDIYAQMAQKQNEIEPFLSDPVFDIGPQKVDKHQFDVPKLTEELDDATLAHYTQLLLTEDSAFSEMFKEITEWLNTLPKFPEQTKKQIFDPTKTS
jgi:uncharacterized membrane protein